MELLETYRRGEQGVHVVSPIRAERAVLPIKEPSRLTCGGSSTTNNGHVKRHQEQQKEEEEEKG